MKKLIPLQIIILIFFVLIMVNPKINLFDAEILKAIQTGILVGLLISLGRMIKIYKNED